MSIILNNFPTSLNVGSRNFKIQAIRKALQKLRLRFQIRRCALLVVAAFALVLIIFYVSSSKELVEEEVKPQTQKRLYNMNLDKINKMVSIAEKFDENGEGEAVIYLI